jgi:hypothetical protein
MNQRPESFDDFVWFGCSGVQDLEHCEIGDGLYFRFVKSESLLYFCQNILLPRGLSIS